MSAPRYRLDRSVLIKATPDIVFRYFTDTPRWANWWGAGSTIDARPGGQLYIRHPDGTEAGGEVIEVVPPDRIVFTYGFTRGTPIPLGASRVTIRLEPDPNGTRLRLDHEFDNEPVRDEHVQGWRFQLSLFANVVTNEVNAAAATTADAWFDAWAEPDATTREQILARIATPGLRFQDRFSSLDGLDDVLAHITAAQRFMPGIRLHRTGEARHCQGMALVDWVMRADGQDRGKGTNAFAFGPDGRVESVTGFWG